MLQILLIHNKFNWKDWMSYPSYLIRIGTCSKWNHIAIRVGDSVIEAIGSGVVINSYSEWKSRANRVVKSMEVKTTNLFLEDVLFTEGEDYGFGDLLETLKRIKAERWEAKEYVGKDRKGLLCSDLACILLGLPKIYFPGDFEYRFPNLLEAKEEYTTSK